MWETWVRSLDWEDPLEKGMATHFSILPWRIPWTVQFRGSKESDTTEQLNSELIGDYYYFLLEKTKTSKIMIIILIFHFLFDKYLNV